MDALTPTTTATADKQAALARRYGANVPPAGPWSETIAQLLDHRSVRDFRPDPLPAGTLETLMAAAQSAATSSNLQAWSAIVVDDPAKRRVLAEIAGNQKHIERCPLYVVFLADLSRHERLAEAEKVEFECLPWTETFLVACIDAALAAQNAVTAAQSLGLRTVYIGAMRNDPARVAELLGLPPRTFAVFGLCVGYADVTSKNDVKPRLPQSSVVHHERYDASAETRDRPAFDAEMERFCVSQDMPATGWTDRMRNRLGPLKSMNGRDRLRGILNKLGFELR